MYADIGCLGHIIAEIVGDVHNNLITIASTSTIASAAKIMRNS
jgi:hypothetical protein